MKSLFIILIFISLPGIAFLQTNSNINDTLFNKVDKNGLKQGYWKKYYHTGNLKYSGLFKDDKPVGEFSRYFESGNLKAKMNFDTLSNYTEAKIYYENGALAAHGYYLKSMKDSLWKFYSYYEKTLISDEIYNKGIKNGLAHKYYSNGNTTEKIEWKNNIKNGIWEQYYQDNSLRLKGQYKDGKLTGDYFVYYPNGHIQVKGHYLEDKRHGKWIFYDKENSIKLELNFHFDNVENEEELTETQQEFFRNIDRNMSKFNEPKQEDFYPSNSEEY